MRRFTDEEETGRTASRRLDVEDFKPGRRPEFRPLTSKKRTVERRGRDES